MTKPLPAIENATLPIGQLKAASYNPRKISDSAMKRLEKSVTTFGLVNPIIVNKRTDYTVVGGNQRLKILKKIGAEQVDVRVIDVTLSREKALNAVLNNEEAMGEFDDEMLANLLKEIDEQDRDLTGFMDAEIKAIIGEFEDEVDPVPEVPTVAISQLGDLWELGGEKGHRLLCGDSAKVEDVTLLMGGLKAFLMATDPPYGVDFEGQKYNPRAKDWDGIEGDKRQGGDLSVWFETFLNAWFPSMNEESAFYFWTAAMSEGAAAAAAIKQSGLHIQSQIIWNKNTLVLGQADYQWKHENCWYAFWKGKRHRWLGGRSQTTVWDVAKVANSKYEHPMQKPVELYQIPIENHTELGEICAEPFSGSGSQIIAGEKLGRRVFSMELDPRYVDVAVKRWQNHAKTKAKNLMRPEVVIA